MRNPILNKGVAFFLTFALLLTMAGCEAEPPAAVKTEFTGEELLEDYDLLWQTLRENYPFFPVLERQGIDPASLYQTYRTMISTRVTTLEGFVWVLDDLFQQMNCFAHLSLATNSTLDIYTAVYEASGANQPQNDLIHSPQTAATYAYLAQSENAASRTLEYPLVDTNYFPEEKTVYFRFHSFHSSLTDRDRTVVRDYLASLDDAEIENIIFDITGNGGGAANYWLEDIVAPFGGIWQWETTFFLADSAVNQAFVFPYYDVQPLSAWQQAQLPEFVTELGLTHFCTVSKTFDFSDSAGLTTNAKRWLLVDGGVYSAADSFAAFCRDTGWATLVGTSTMGDGSADIDPVMVALKNTGLIVRFSSVAGSNSLGQLNAEYGTPPNYASLRQETPLQTVLRLLQADMESDG